MDENEYSFVAIDDEGNEVTCDVVSVLKDEKNEEVYVVYTDYTLNEQEQFNTYLSIIEENNGKFYLKDIKDREKYDYIFNNAQKIYGKALKELLSSDK